MNSKFVFNLMAVLACASIALSACGTAPTSGPGHLCARSYFSAGCLRRTRCYPGASSRRR